MIDSENTRMKGNTNVVGCFTQCGYRTNTARECGEADRYQKPCRVLEDLQNADYVGTNPRAEDADWMLLTRDLLSADG